MFARSIRVRLAAWYVAILTVIIVLFSVGVYFTLRQTLNDNLNDSLRTRAALVDASVEYDAAGNPTLDLPTDVRDPNLDDSFERVFDTSSNVVFDNSKSFGASPADPAELARALQGGDHFATRGNGEKQARILTRRLTQAGRTVGVVQVGQSTSDVESTLHNLLLILAVGGPIVLLAASVGGWWLSSRALGPIDHVTRLAREITGHDLSRRLNLDLPDDEVGRLARTFDEMIARLDAMFERQRQFTADASHELRTPITAMKGQIDVALQRAREPADYQRVLGTVNEQLDRVTRLIGGLLMLARSDAGALPIERETVSIRSLVESVTEQVAPAARAKGIGVAMAPGPAAASVHGDADLLLQLLLNLADNAVKYTEHGTITLGWSVDGGLTTLLVQDTGSGIPDEHRSLIFERFHRMDVARAREHGGAGLGLAICKWIAEAHDGRIGLESSAAGSTFWVTLPNS